MSAAAAATTGMRAATTSPSDLEAGTKSRRGGYSLCERVTHYGTDTVIGANLVGSLAGGVWSYVQGTYPQAGLFTLSVLVSGGMLYVAERFFALQSLKNQADQLVNEEHQLEGDEQALARIRQQFDEVTAKLQQSEQTLAQRGNELDATKEELRTTVDKLGVANGQLEALKAAQEKDLGELRASIAQMSKAQKELQGQLDQKDAELKKETANVAAIKQDNDHLGQLLAKMQEQVSRMQSSFAGFKDSVSSFVSLNASFQSTLPEFTDLIKQFQMQGTTLGKETDTLDHSVQDFDLKFKADIDLLGKQMSQARQLTQAIFSKLNDEIVELRSDIGKFKQDSASLDALQRQIKEKEEGLRSLQTTTEAELAKLDQTRQSLQAAEGKLAGLQAQISSQEQQLAAAVRKAAEQGDHMASTEDRLHHDMDRAGDLLRQFQEATQSK